MGDPDLHSDEKTLLTTQDVFVKSIPFEAILTNKRIILIDRKKNLIPQKDILLATIGDVVPAENAIRDQTITLSLITSSGETRQLVLTFSRTAGGGRKRERDEWVKSLKELTSSSIQKTIRKVVPSFEPEPRKVEAEQKKKVREQTAPRIEITSRPGVKKEIEGARPIKTIIDTPNVPPKPIETSSLPIGIFCNRCGNRVPPDSVFCNRCGSRIIPPEEQEKSLEPAVPQVSVESSLPAQKAPVSQPERRERPIEREIQSIEPLIEGSVPRMTESPPVQPLKTPEPSPPQPAPTDESASIAHAAQSIIDAVTPLTTAVPEEVTPVPGSAPAQTVAQESPARQPPSGIPPDTRTAAGSPPLKGRRTVALLVGIVVIVAVICVAFLYWNYLTGGPVIGPSQTVTPTPAPTTQATPSPKLTPTSVPTATVTSGPATVIPTTPQVIIPESGVWIRVTYANTFTGTAGLAGSQQDIGGTGDQFYSVPTSGGIVEASVQKTDGSGAELLVRIYKDGELIQSGSTTSPKGTVEIQADLKPKTTATTTIPPAPAKNTTASS